MSAEIIKTVRESYPPLRFIGKRYLDRDRDPKTGMFAPRWSEWHSNGWFGVLEKNATVAPEHGDAYLALMGDGGEGFEYWIGMFFAPDTSAPNGFDYIDTPAIEAGVCWIHGTEPDIYMQHMQCAAEMLAEEIPIPRDDAPRRWLCFERYGCPRFTSPDTDGKVILDYGIFFA